DDIKSQVGATIIHRVLTRLFRDRGVKLERTYQLNFGGNTDFLNMLERDRLMSKKISKTRSVTSQLDYDIGKDNVHIGPSDYVPWLNDRKWAYIRLEGRSCGDVPLNVELKLEVADSPNSAGIVLDAVRCPNRAFDRDRNDPDVARVARRAFQNYGRVLMDFLLLGSLTPSELIARMTNDGRENLDAALAGGRGAIMAVPHMGSWDMAGSYAGALGYRIAAVAERFPGSLNEAVVQTRQRFGLNVIMLGRSAVREITEALKANSIVALLCDLEQGSGVPVRFFGRNAVVPGGPAAIAIKTGAPLVPACPELDRDPAELRRISKLNFRNHAKAYADLMQLPRARVEAMRTRLKVQGWEHVDAARAQGKGALVVSCHMGSYEVVAAIWSAT